MRARLSALAIGFGLAVFGVAGTAAPAQAEPGTEHATIVQTSPTGPQKVFLAGPIVANGIDTPVNDNEDVFVFPNGTITVDHQTVTVNQESFDPVSCVFRHNETDSFQVVAATGAYAGVQWRGTATVNVVGRGCDQNALPSLLVIVVNASGPLSTGGGA